METKWKTVPGEDVVNHMKCLRKIWEKPIKNMRQATSGRGDYNGVHKHLIVGLEIMKSREKARINGLSI